MLTEKIYINIKTIKVSSLNVKKIARNSLSNQEIIKIVLDKISN